jgi:8-oxo-dGTP diphosphatase
MIEVAAAIIEDESGRILIARRAKGKSQEGMWEFPGGKLEVGESPEECLRRELLEEMGITIEPYSYVGVNEHDYGTVTIRLLAYKAKFVSGEIVLTDHDAYRWVRTGEFGEYTFAPADVPFLELI